MCGGQGLMIAFDGTDGTGKTTAAHRLVETLREMYPNQDVVFVSIPEREGLSGILRNLMCRDPVSGYTYRQESDDSYRLVFTGPQNDIDEPLYKPVEQMIALAAWINTYQTKILPLLEADTIVVMDRTPFLSHLAYRSTDENMMLERFSYTLLHAISIVTFVPDLTIYLEGDYDTIRARLQQRGGMNHFDDITQEQFDKRMTNYREAVSVCETACMKIQTLPCSMETDDLITVVLDTIERCFSLGVTNEDCEIRDNTLYAVQNNGCRTCEDH